MTRPQISRLRNILAKLEALQNNVADREEQERLGAGKNELLRALALAECKSETQ